MVYLETLIFFFDWLLSVDRVNKERICEHYISTSEWEHVQQSKSVLFILVVCLPLADGHFIVFAHYTGPCSLKGFRDIDFSQQLVSLSLSPLNIVKNWCQLMICPGYSIGFTIFTLRHMAPCQCVGSRRWWPTPQPFSCPIVMQLWPPWHRGRKDKRERWTVTGDAGHSAVIQTQPSDPALIVPSSAMTGASTSA